MSLSFVVFDVGRGLCVAIRSPSGNLAMIDCGTSTEFSPVQWLSQQQWVQHGGYRLTELMVTHPHLDHIADIQRVTTMLPPSVIMRRQDLNWNRVLQASFDSVEMQHYINRYLLSTNWGPVVAPPNWGDGMILQPFFLDSQTAEQISASDSSYVNNTSVVAVLKYKSYTFCVLGDIETEGLKAILQRETLRAAVGYSGTLDQAIRTGVDFLVTSHHGHSSGFSSDWFNVAGPTKKFNIASERRKRLGEVESQTQVDSRYSRPECCLCQNREGRMLVSTKSDGHIHISISDDGTWNWQAGR